MDIEAAVARRIAKATGVPAYLEVPKDAPGSFTTVERIGGGGSYMEPVQLAIDCWAGKKQRKAAQALSDRVKAAVYGLDEEPNVFHPEVTNAYRRERPGHGTLSLHRAGPGMGLRIDSGKEPAAWQRPTPTTRQTSAPARA